LKQHYFLEQGVKITFIYLFIYLFIYQFPSLLIFLYLSSFLLQSLRCTVLAAQNER